MAALTVTPGLPLPEASARLLDLVVIAKRGGPIALLRSALVLSSLVLQDALDPACTCGRCP